MNRRTLGILVTMLFVIGFAMAPAVAQPNCFYEKANAGTHGPSEDHPDIATPGSLLVYPFWTAEQGGITLITVTNTNCGHVRCYPSYNESRYGDVMLHFQYVDGETCLLIDRWEVLSPNDTFSVLAGEHGLSDGFGWLYITSWDPEFFVPIDFDWLVGDLIVGSGEENFLWQCQAIPFQSFGDCYPGYAPCRGPYPMQHLPADKDYDLLADFDAAADPGVGAFDEFNCFPNELYISHFNEQGGALDGTLVLLTTLPEVNGDENNSVLLNFRFYNMDEHEISAQVEFDCMLVTSLADITPFVSNLPDNQNESGPWDRFRTGWVRIEPLDLTGDGPANGHAPVLGAFFQLAGSGFGAGTLLHMENQPGVYGGSNPTCTETRAQGSLPY